MVLFLEFWYLTNQDSWKSQTTWAGRQQRNIFVIVLTVADVKFTLRSHNQGFFYESSDYELQLFDSRKYKSSFWHVTVPEVPWKKTV